MVRQAVHLQPMEDPKPEQVEAPEGGCGPREAHAGASFWQDLWPLGERSPGWSRFAGRTCDPMGDPRWSSLVLEVCTPWKGPTLEQFVKNCSLWEGLMLEKFMEDCLPWEGSHAGAGAECEESSP
ncbi:zinc finger and BTB domain-containing protein 5 [Grus japonensis]|uniref:Zinc finger and BTB domain-containing protein 5 n=1 Tax=Grus japonensis TaxID=30415 RepID=A0ABC9Y4S5_GRUJA